MLGAGLQNPIDIQRQTRLLGNKCNPHSVLSLTMADKLRTLQNLEALQIRYVGTGHADTTKYEWASNIVRDSYASYIGHPPLLEFIAIGMGENKEKVRAMMVEGMVRGAGNPPEVSADRALLLRV